MSVNIRDRDRAGTLAIIVNFFKASQVRRSVELLRKQEIVGGLEIVVIDNSCNDDQWAIINSIADLEQCIRMERNEGYSKAVNRGLNFAGGRQVVLVSPDIEVEDRRAIATLADVLRDNAELGAIAPMQYEPSGSSAEIARSFPTFFGLLRRRLQQSRRFDDRSLLAAWKVNVQGYAKVDWVQSSFLLLDGDLVDRGLRLNEQFFVFMADTWLGHDLVNRYGKAVGVYSSVSVKGDGRRASEGGIFAMMGTKAGRFHIRDALMYFLLRRFH